MSLRYTLLVDLSSDLQRSPDIAHRASTQRNDTPLLSHTQTHSLKFNVCGIMHDVCHFPEVCLNVLQNECTPTSMAHILYRRGVRISMVGKQVWAVCIT